MCVCLLVVAGRSISLGSNPALPIRHCSSATPGLRYKNLGKSGLRVSNVGLGTWSIFTPSVSEEQAEGIIKLAMEAGINLFDLSEAHSGKFSLPSPASYCFTASFSAIKLNLVFKIVN